MNDFERTTSAPDGYTNARRLIRWARNAYSFGPEDFAKARALADECDRVLNEQGKLRAALAYYADPASYAQNGWNDDTFPVVHEDGGAIARAACGAHPGEVV